MAFPKGFFIGASTASHQVDRTTQTRTPKPSLAYLGSYAK